MTTLDLAVPTVHCNACKLNIEEALEELAGVNDATVDLAAKPSESTTTRPPSTTRRWRRPSKLPATRSTEASFDSPMNDHVHRRSNQPNHQVAPAAHIIPTDRTA